MYSYLIFLDRDVLVLKTVSKQSDSIFDLEVTVEELSQVQKARRDLINKEDKEIESKIEQLLKSANAEVIYNGVHTKALEISEHLKSILNANSLHFIQQSGDQSKTLGGLPTIQQTVQGQSIVLPTGTNQQSYQLVMDPRGVIVGAVTTPNPNTPAPPLIYQQKVNLPTGNNQIPETNIKTRRGGARQASNVTQMQKTAVVPQKVPPKTLNKPLQLKTIVNKAVPIKSPLGTIPKTVHVKMRVYFI